MKRLCIYTTIGKGAEQVRGRYVSYALQKYKDVSDRLIVVTDVGADHPNFSEINELADLIVPSRDGFIRVSLDGYRMGLAAIDDDELEAYDEILFVDTACYGPFFPLASILDHPKRLLVDFWSVGFFTKRANLRIAEDIKLDRVLTLNFFSVNRRVATSPVFLDFMRRDSAYLDYVEYRISGEHALHLALDQAGFKWNSLIAPEQTHTSEPLLFEAAEVVRLGCPIVLRNIFALDPVVADMQAVECSAVLDVLRETTDFDINLIWESILPFQQLRLIQTNMDDLRIIESEAPESTKRQWNLGGKVAVVAHVFYVDMLSEFLELVANIPCDFDFFISTSSQRHKQSIELALQSFDCGGRSVVRVVERNRGRDMSALFITFRDVMLSGEYAWALRLHSKRTPQMPWQVGQSFKRHLVDNLVPSRHFVQSLFDLLEKPEYQNVGIVAPPVVHIGFGTLGHSWFNNRKPLEQIAKDLKIDVPFDDDTPVAAYGTMYWFRPKALAPMFQYDWNWDDYNEEPHHIDGGLAHVQERLICYCAQHQGFRTLAVMSTKQASRNYLKLEYKHQLLSSRFPVSDIRLQYRLAASSDWGGSITLYTRFLNMLERGDQRFRQLAPRLWVLTRPVVNIVWPILKGIENFRARHVQEL